MKRKLLTYEDLKFLIRARSQILLTLLIVALSLPGISQQLSPSLLCSGGETFVADNQSLEFAIGEIATETFQSESNSLTQGFFQGSQEGTNIEETFIKNANVRVFPNPTKGQININYEETPKYIEVIDMHGHSLFVIQNSQKTAKLNIGNLQNGVYLLRLVFEGNIPIIKRIVKN